MRIAKSQLRNIINEAVTDVLSNICEGKTVSMRPDWHKDGKKASLTLDTYDEDEMADSLADALITALCDSFHRGHMSRQSVLCLIDNYIDQGYMTEKESRELIDKYAPDFYGASNKIKAMYTPEPEDDYDYGYDE